MNGDAMTVKRFSPRRLAIFAVLFALLATFKSLSAFHDRYLLTINHTESLSNWAFIVDRMQSPKRGDLIYFVPPDNPYYKDTGFVKIVAGVAGDVVSRVDSTFHVNGEPVCDAKSTSREGHPLAPGPVGIIPPDSYFIFTPHRDSYDSRYQDIGWVGRDRVIGVARPIL